MQNNMPIEKNLEEEKIDSKSSLLINPDNLFWALRFDNEERTENKIITFHNKLAKKLDRDMLNFRFKTDLNSVYVNPTDLCNADCPYCYVPPEKRKNGKQMSESELNYVLDKIDKYFSEKKEKSFIKPIVIFHASEPLLVKEMLFSAIKKYTRKFHFGVQTNAILLTKEDVNFLKQYKVSVGISLDSHLLKANNSTRKSQEGSNFHKAVQAIEWFDGYEGVNVISTITRFNVKHLPALVKFLHSKKVSCVLLNPVRATRNEVVKLRPDQKTLTKYFIYAIEEAMRLSKTSKREIIIGNFSNIVVGIIAPQSRRLMCDISPCGGGRCFFAITANGDMIPCGEFVGLKEFSGGNIFNTSIEESISSDAFRKVRTRTVEKIKECDVCIYRNICGAPCPAEVYSLTKNINSISVYCDFYKKIIGFAFRLIGEDKIRYLFHKDAFKSLKFDYKLRL